MVLKFDHKSILEIVLFNKIEIVEIYLYLHSTKRTILFIIESIGVVHSK